VATSSETYDGDSRFDRPFLYDRGGSSTLAAYHWNYDSGGEVTEAFSYLDASVRRTSRNIRRGRTRITFAITTDS